MGRFFKSKTKQSGYGQAADKRATSGKFSDFPTKIAKKINTLQTKIDTIIDTHKAVGKSLPISKKNISKKNMFDLKKSLFWLKFKIDTIEILTKGGPSKTTYVMMYAIFEKAIMQNITSIGAAITVVFIVFIEFPSSWFIVNWMASILL